MAAALALAIVTAGVFAQAVDENFDDGLDGWRLWKDARQVMDGTNGYIQLTGETDWQRGQLWYATKLPANWFVADFQFRIRDTGQNGNADGLAFGWVEDIPTTDDWQLGGPGHGLAAYPTYGYRGYAGYFVEIDTYPNGSFEGAAIGTPHIALMRSHVDAAPELLCAFDSFALTYNQWYDMRVALEPVDAGVRVKVWYDAAADGEINDSQAPVIDRVIENYALNSAYFGFTAATGGSGDYHDIDNFRLQATPELGPATLLGVSALVGWLVGRRRQTSCPRSRQGRR